MNLAKTEPTLDKLWIKDNQINHFRHFDIEICMVIYQIGAYCIY